MKLSALMAVVLGLVSLANVFATPLVVGNAGFEMVVPIVHDPPGLGVWFGNAGDMVMTEYGIVPTEGSRMLKFNGTNATTNIDQAIDATNILAGTTVTFLADVNRVPGSLTDFLISISAFNYALMPNDPSFTGEVGTHHIATALHTVSAGTWMTLQISAVVPPNTVTLALELGFMKQADIPGGYADNVRLFEGQVPEPSSVVLACLGLVSLVGWGLRKRRAGVKPSLGSPPPGA